MSSRRSLDDAALLNKATAKNVPPPPLAREQPLTTAEGQCAGHRQHGWAVEARAERHTLPEQLEERQVKIPARIQTWRARFWQVQFAPVARDEAWIGESNQRWEVGGGRERRVSGSRHILLDFLLSSLVLA
jgi:hypothetical protein